MKNANNQHAFTIVELLIVIVIIAILAAITIVAYNGIQQRARASAASSALSQAAKKLELYKVDNSTYPTSTNLSAAGITNSNDTTYQYTSDGTTYCLTATNVTVSYYLNSTTTPSPTAGGCPGHGVGGVSAITNLVVNPSVETGASGWYNVSSGTITRSTDRAHSGAYSLKVTPGATTYSGVGANIPGTVGTQYTASVYVYVMAAQYMNFAADGYGCNSQVTISPGWTRMSCTGVMTSSSPIFMRLIPSTGGVFYVDDLMVTEGSTLYNYADGNSPNWVWNGTANASTSTGPAP